MPPFLEGALGVLVGIAAGLGALGVLSRLRPVRWLWRHLVVDPVSEWFRSEVRDEVAPILAEVRPNGGASFRDEVTARAEEAEASAAKAEAMAGEVLRRMAVDAEERTARQTQLDRERRLLATERRQVANQLSDWAVLHADLQHTIDRLADGHPEIRRPPGDPQ